MAQLEVSNLSLEVPGRRLLSGVAFEVGESECLAVMGPSGSGKTSLLNSLCGITTPSSGSVRIDGVELTALGSSARASFRLRRVGVVFQFGELLPELTALENVALPLRLLGSSRLDSERLAENWLGRLGLGGRDKAHPGVLSGGEILRVGIARAMVHAPRLILADEPTGALDEDSTLRVAELFVDVAKDSGAAVVVTTHDPLVASKADRVLQIRHGRLVPAQEPDSSATVGT